MKAIDTVLRLYARVMGGTSCEDKDCFYQDEIHYHTGPNPDDIAYPPEIDLDFAISLLEMKEKVTCGDCQGNKTCFKGEDPDIYRCDTCNGTGKIERHVIDREKYLDALVVAIWGKGGPPAEGEDVDYLLAIHNATVNDRIEAMGKVIDGQS